MGNETIWILGGGKFGKRAAEQMGRKYPDAGIFVVDQQPISGFGDNVQPVVGEGVEWFADNFGPDSPVTRIIPALPIHLAVDWLQKRLAADGRTLRSVPLPESLCRKLPNPIRIDSSRIAVSHADFLCPPNCPEPDKICTVTRKKRPLPLYQLLERINEQNFVPLIVRSRQFAPGVGGFFPSDLWNLLEFGKKLAGSPLLIGTACKCHGIVDGMLVG